MKQEEVNKFLNFLSKIMDENSKVYQNFFEKNNEIQKFYSLQLELVNSEFSKIEEMILKQRNEILENLNNYYTASMNLLNENMVIIIKNQEEMEKFNNDISQNFNAILNDIQISPFKDIIQRYTDKVSKISYFIDKINQENIEILKIDFKNDDGILGEKILNLKDIFQYKKNSCKINENLKENDQLKCNLSSNKTIKSNNYLAYSSIIDLQPFIKNQNSNKDKIDLRKSCRYNIFNNNDKNNDSSQLFKYHYNYLLSKPSKTHSSSPQFRFLKKN